MQVSFRSVGAPTCQSFNEVSKSRLLALAMAAGLSERGGALNMGH